MYSKYFLSLVLITFISIHCAQAQVSVGVYKGNFYSQLGVGTNPENKFFGEGRLFAGDFANRFFGLEAIGQYNFTRSEWYNISGGLMLGYHEFDDLRVGLPAMLAIKPLESHRNLSIILEATPFYRIDIGEGLSLRANLGLRYTLGRNRE